jgi:hypothetical protein
MKITRLEKSYRLSLSPAEFDALIRIAELGRGDVESDTEGALSGLSTAAKRAVLKGRLGRFDAFRIDDFGGSA